MLYLLQTVSPLRLDGDSVNYLFMATHIADGRAVPETGVPPGYSVIVALLDRAGLGSPFYFILANCIFLAAGVLAVWRIIGPENDLIRHWVVFLTLLSFPVIKTIAMPLPEAAFFGLSLIAVALMCASQSAAGVKQIVLLLISAGLVWFAVSIRLIGVALIPALAWAAIADAYRHLIATRRRRFVGAWAAGLFVVPVLLAVFTADWQFFPYYRREVVTMDLRGISLSAIQQHVTLNFTTLGELIVNLPLAKFRGLRPIFLLIGAASAVGLIVVARVSRKLSPADVYVVAFLGILGVWPYYAARLWMPIVPLLIVYVVPAVKRAVRGHMATIAVRAYLVWFVFAGLGALAFTSRISLAGDDFSKVYGHKGGLSTPPPGVSPNEGHNRRARELMRRYGTGVEDSPR